jgi:NADH:ubiquinone oxidoreductase subunit 5 (subunit L)/multisubunit Na+/H+ antiporter MnhA subunit
MEAPVPASALIHSATLVSAGIYLILRFNFLYEISAYSHIILPLVGSLTSFYGGIVAAYQYDIKRILAYSTISHCGFLVVLCSLNCHEYTILYLYVHGFFKAASFLCVGNIIRFNFNYQDIRFMGGFYKYLPFECYALFICFLNLAGCPFTFGFLIKHLLLTSFDLKFYYLYVFVYLNLIFGALTGLFYCSKIFFNVFFDIKRSKKIVYLNNQALPFSDYNNDHMYFSNTTLFSNFSIFSLIIVAYLIIMYIFINFCNIDNLHTDISYNISTSAYFNYFNSDLNLLFNIG